MTWIFYEFSHLKARNKDALAYARSQRLGKAARRQLFSQAFPPYLQYRGYRMVVEKSCVAENFRRVSKSRRSKLESRNLKLAKNNVRLGISNFEIESLSFANQAKVLISLNRHKVTATRTAKQRAAER